jgi:N-acetylmuramoyl-L-alanine amidase
MVVYQEHFHWAGNVLKAEQATATCGQDRSASIVRMSFRLTACTALALLLAGCATPTRTTTPGGVPIDIRHNSENQDSRVLFLVLHYTVANLPLSIKVLTARPHEVSAHYLVSDDPQPVIYRLVPEERRAWHSGPSFWRGHRQLNASSIGIEIVHPGFVTRPDGSREYVPFPPAQIEAVVALVKDIVQRHNIRPERIVGHSDVLPQFKQDPGPTFPWKRLADEGLIAWPDAQLVAQQRAVYEAALPDVAWFQQMLARHGFEVVHSGTLDEATRNVIAAFQMRFRPSNYNGEPDAETAAILHALVMPVAAR